MNEQEQAEYNTALSWWEARHEAEIMEAIDAIIPEVPTMEQIGILRGISGNLAKFPEDWNTAKHYQSRRRNREIPYETNAELAAGMWINTTRPALVKAFMEIYKGRV